MGYRTFGKDGPQGQMSGYNYMNPSELPSIGN